MHYLDESRIFLFLIEVALLLGLARAAGIFLQRRGQPAITGEVLVGLLLGPTVLGRLAPGVHRWLFPPDVVQATMLDTLAWLGILFFLLKTGLETDFAAAWRQRGRAVLISLSDLALPMALAFALCLLLPSGYLADPSRRVLFAVFVATIMTISALPVTARVLQDLNLYRSDVGLLTMCALTINDVAGWLLFAIILGFVSEAGMRPSAVALILASTLAFAALALTLGRRLVNRAFEVIVARRLPEPGTSLTLICLLGMAFGALTIRIGIHALFGFFLAGIVAGESRALSEKTRHVISQMVRAVLVPMFFATLGLKIDFLANFDPLLVLFILIVGVAGRYLGAWFGVSMTGAFKDSRSLISIAHTPGGEMQIVIGLLALEYGVITPTVFVAIVFAAVVSSVALGPWMKLGLGKLRTPPVLTFFSPSGVIADMRSRTRDEAIAELCGLAARQWHLGPAAAVTARVIERENLMGTGLEVGIAVPHARLSGSKRPAVVFGRSVPGIDWNSPDGQPARLVFLILTPEQDDASQIRILRAVASSMRRPEARDRLRSAADDEQLWSVLEGLLSRESAPGSPAPA